MTERHTAARAERPRVRLAVLLAACALALAAGCGSDEPETFDEDGFAITFEYPGDFERTTDVSTERAEGRAEESVALADVEDNAIFVQRYALNKPTPGEREPSRRSSTGY